MENPSLPDFRLASLLALSREGSVTAAAASLGLSQPAVSRHLEELEAEYGVPLFEKVGRRLHPTAAGAALLAGAGRIEALYRETRRQVQAASGRRDYRIGATLTVAEFLLPDRLAAFRAAHPADGLGLVVANTEEVLRGVRSGELSFGIVEGPFDREGLETALVARDSLVAIGPANRGASPAASGALALDDFLALPLILRERGSGTRAVLEARLAELGRESGRLGPAMEIGSIGTIKALVARGLGYSVVSALAVAAELGSESLALLEVEGMPIPREIRLVGLPGSAGAADFTPFLDLAHPAVSG